MESALLSKLKITENPYLLLEIDAVQRQRPRDDGERHEVVIRQQFRRSER